jgi:preprotein translocase subunit SecF
MSLTKLSSRTAVQVGSSRHVFDFVGMGRAVVLAALVFIVAGSWHLRAHGLTLGGDRDLDIVLGALLAVTLYSAVRFSPTIAVATVLPVALDLLIVLALLCLLNLSLDPACTVALLSVIAYSSLGKMTLLGRITDNLRNAPAGQPLSLSRLANTSIRQTLECWRRLLWGVSLVVVAVFLFAGPALRAPTLVVSVGVFAATASSVFIASALWLTLQQRCAQAVVPIRYRAALNGRLFMTALLVLATLGLASGVFPG